MPGAPQRKPRDRVGVHEPGSGDQDDDERGQERRRIRPEPERLVQRRPVEVGNGQRLERDEWVVADLEPRHQVIDRVLIDPADHARRAERCGQRSQDAAYDRETRATRREPRHAK